MHKRQLFFWIERLQISPSERILIIILLSALVSIALLRVIWEPGPRYDAEFYQPIEAEFNRLSLIKQQEEASLLARYYPDQYAGTKDQGEAFVPITDRSIFQGTSTQQDSVVTGSHFIYINTANREELTLLPGIGPVIAERIVAYRDEHGDFTSFDAIMNVRGIGPTRLEQIKPYLKL